MRQLLRITDGVSIHAAAAALPFPPAAIASLLPDWWDGTSGVMLAFDLEVRATEAVELTGAELVGAKLHALVVADDTFTATHGTETFTAVAHTLQTGDGPFRVSNAGGALPAGLEADTDYWVIRVDADNFKLADSLADALAGTVHAITGNGTGTHTISDTADTKRVYWHSRGLLQDPINLTEQKAFATRIDHRPGTIAYALVGTLDTGTVSAELVPVQEVP